MGNLKMNKYDKRILELLEKQKSEKQTTKSAKKKRYRKRVYDKYLKESPEIVDFIIKEFNKSKSINGMGAKGIHKKLAKQLNLPNIHVSIIISKYINETER